MKKCLRHCFYKIQEVAVPLKKMYTYTFSVELKCFVKFNSYPIDGACIVFI